MSSTTKRLSTLLLLLMAVAGCATPPHRVAPETAVKLKRIGVVSAVADSFTRRYVGWTVFNNEFEDLDIRDWAIDQTYEAQMAAAIDQVPGKTAVRAPYDAAAFAHVNDATGVLWRTATDEPNWAAIAEASQAHCAANQLDALLVTARWNSVDVLGAGYFSGVGIYMRGAGPDISLMYVMANLGLIDCTNGQLLAARRLLKFDTLSGPLRLAIPVTTIPEDISLTPIPQWSADVRDTVRSELASVPESSWLPTIRQFFRPKR